MKKIVLATANKNKIREIGQILAEYGITPISRDEAGIDPNYEVIEDCDSFEGNSYKKAKEIMDLCGEITIADDSGLMIDALDGAPGIYSARFAGDSKNYDDNNQKVLALMEGVPFEKRTARFVSCITMLFPDGRKIVATGYAEGHILEEPQGTAGFGYDPIFQPLGYDRSYAELSAEEKNAISHRGTSLAVLREKLKDVEF